MEWEALAPLTKSFPPEESGSSFPEGNCSKEKKNFAILKDWTVFN